MISSLQKFGLVWFSLAISACRDQVGDTPEPSGSVGGKPAGQPFVLTSKDERVLMDDRAKSFLPASDGWDSEIWHEKTNQSLKSLGESLTEGESLREWASDKGDSQSGERLFRPADLELRHDFGGVQVRQWDGPAKRFEGTGLLSALEALQGEVAGGWSRFKQYGIEITEPKSGPGLVTQVFAWFGGDREGGEFVQEMHWSLEWKIEDGNPRLVALTMENWQESWKAKPGDWFQDRSEDILGHLSVYHKQLTKGANFWVERIPGDSGRRLQGISLGDLNGDGWDDVFCPQPEGLPNCVFMSEDDGSVRDRAGELGLDWLDETVSALIVDFDNDGDQDLAIGTSDRLVFMRNRGGNQGFERGQDFPQEDCSALCAADFDGDGLLDLFVGNYLGAKRGTTVVKPDEVYDAVDGSPNHFYRNEGDFIFADVTEQVGLGEGARRLALAGSWEDFDDDGDQDLYVANDFGKNCLYVNEGGRFVEKSHAFGVDDPSTGMSVSWGDPNGDGRMDLMVGNMFSAAGNRVTRQPRFRDELSENLDLERVRYLARGNTLLINGPGRFRERSGPSGVRNSQWTWSMLFSDINNDGREDILALNGYITGRDKDDL
jgi:hypothetical protein